MAQELPQSSIILYSPLLILDESSDNILFAEIVRPFYITPDNKWVCTVSPIDLKENLKQIEKGIFLILMISLAKLRI